MPFVDCSNIFLYSISDSTERREKSDSTNLIRIEAILPTANHGLIIGRIVPFLGNAGFGDTELRMALEILVQRRFSYLCFGTSLIPNACGDFRPSLRNAQVGPPTHFSSRHQLILCHCSLDGVVIRLCFLDRGLQRLCEFVGE